MSQYAELDQLITDAIRNRSHPLRNFEVAKVASRIATETERQTMRIIDIRLQALRKAGKIQHCRKQDRTDGVGGWHVVA